MVSHQVIALCGRQFAWKVHNWLTRLFKHSPNVGIRHVHPHHKRLTKNRDTKDWRTRKHGLKAVKCRLFDSRPMPNLTFPKKVQQGGSKICKMVHILAIVVSQAKELIYMSDTSGCGPFTNGRQLGRVRMDLAMANYMAQVKGCPSIL